MDILTKKMATPGQIPELNLSKSSTSSADSKEISAEQKCLYFGALMVLIIIACWLCMRWASPERMQNVGYPYAFGASSFTQGYAEYPQSGISSGAYMRNLSQEMSQPVQGEYTSPSAMRVKGMDDFTHPEGLPGQVSHPGMVQLAAPHKQSGIGAERLVSNRGEPDFWELPQELRSAQVKEAGVRLENFASQPRGGEFLVGGNNTVASYDVDAYTYPWVY